MSRILKKYNDSARNVFDNNHIMSFLEAKSFIEEAYNKREKVRHSIRYIRRNRGDISLMWVEYRKAQKLCVSAYYKCLNDIKKGGF